MFINVRKTGVVTLAASALLLLSVAAAQAKDAPVDNGNSVLATVNGEKILKKDVLGVLKSLPVKPEETDKIVPVVLDQMINEKLINAATVKAGIEKDPEFKQRLAAARDQLLKTLYLERYLKDKLSDEAVKAEYERFKKDNKGKEEVHARHILVATEAEAKQIIKELSGGAKFEDLAKERSSGPTAKNGGDIGYFAKGEIIPEFSDAAFKLKPGTYTKEPVKSPFGWHVIYSEDRRERMVPELKEVEGAIRNRLGQEAVDKLVKDLRAKADIKRFGPDGKPLGEESKKN